MKINPNTLKRAAILAVVLGALLAGFFVLFEKAEKTVSTPGSPEARKNPFLAAERFLKASGISTETVDQRSLLVNLPPGDELIFISRLGGNLPREREDRLLQWVEKGGALVITHDKLWREKYDKSGNTLLDRLGVRKFDACEAENGAPDEDEGPGPGLGNKKEMVRVSMDDGTVAEIRFMARYILEDAGEVSWQGHGGKTGPHILSRRMGRGRLIVLSDNGFLRNAHIGARDHAFYLAALSEGRDRVWILHNSAMPPFLSILLRQAPLFFLSLFFLTLAFIFWMTLRIGPRYQVRDNASRNIAEHLLYAGHFLRRRDQGKTLINGTRLAIEAKMAGRYRSWKQQTKERRYALIAAWAQVPQADVVFAFTADIDRPAALIRATAILQKINSAINTQKRGSP